MRCITKVVDVGEEEKELQLWLIIVNGRLSVFWIFSNLSSAGQGPLAGLILSQRSFDFTKKTVFYWW